MSEETLQIAEKRRDLKGQGEKERYTHLNAEFQRIARRGKKAFLSDQCKETEDTNKMGKTINFLMFKLVLKEAEEPKIKLPTSVGSSKKKGVPEKHLFLLY